MAKPTIKLTKLTQSKQKNDYLAKTGVNKQAKN